MLRERTDAQLNRGAARAEKPEREKLPGIRQDIVLASGSPRRIEMFRERGYKALVHPADIDEHLPFAMPPETAVMYLSLAKALHVAEEVCGLIIAADTIVVCDGEIIGKPADEEEAFRVLSRLRGRAHQVITGVCLIDNSAAGSAVSGGSAISGDPAATNSNAAPNSNAISGDPVATNSNAAPLIRKRGLYEVTDVYFGDYSDKELRAYVQTPEPYDKAGGYAIQETFGKYIDHIEGDQDNVIGFPMYRVEPYLNGEPL